MGTAVESGTSGEQTVAVADLTNILVCAARGNDSSCAAVLPKVDIVLGVESHNTLSGRAAGGLYPYAVGKGLCKQTVGVSIPKVGFGKKRQLVKIVR